MSMPYSSSLVHARELGADALGRDVGAQVEVGVRDASRKISEWMLRATTSRGASPSTRVVAFHEGHALLVHQPRACAAHRLRDQEARRVCGGRRRSVELHVLGVDHARAGAVGHREAVRRASPRDSWCEVDLPEPARRKHRDAGEAADDLARRLLEHVGADAGQRVVDGAAVAAVVAGVSRSTAVCAVRKRTRG